MRCRSIRGPPVEFGQLTKDDDEDDARPELKFEAIYDDLGCTLVGPTPTSNRIELVANGVPMMWMGRMRVLRMTRCW